MLINLKTGELTFFDPYTQTPDFSVDWGDLPLHAESLVHEVMLWNAVTAPLWSFLGKHAFVIVTGLRDEGYSIWELSVFTSYDKALEQANRLTPGWVSQEGFALDTGEMPYKAWMHANGVDYVAILLLGVRP